MSLLDRFALLSCVLLLCGHNRAQSTGKANDSVQAARLIELSVGARNNHADSALYHANAALALSQSIGNEQLIERAHNQLGILYRYRGELDSAISHYECVLRSCERLKDSACTIKAWHNLGVIARKKGEISEALAYALKGISYLQRTGDSLELGHAYNSLGNIYSVQENWPKAIEYYGLELSVQQDVQNKRGESRALYNLGVTYYNQGDLHKADSVLRERLILAQRLQDKRSLANTYHSLGVIQTDLEYTAKARQYFLQAAALQQEMEDKEGQLFTLLGLGDLEVLEEHWKAAEGTFNEALNLALETGLRDEELTGREQLAHVLERQGRIPEAMDQLKAATRLKDSLRDESTSMRLLELQEKYETDKKEKENQLLQQENQLAASEIETKSQSLLFRNAALVVLALILVLSGLLLFNYRQRLHTNRMLAAQREELNRQKMLDLVREQELAYMNATLIGQETERNRIAADLHDGLSNMLVTVKLHFENLSDQLSGENPEVVSRYQQAIALLDDLCKKARSLSHELVDEHSQFRLEPALQELVGIIEQTGQLKVELSTHGLDQPVGAAIENAVFHTLRELIGNCLKHAKASMLSIQLTRFDEALNILVEDNGIGFDPSSADATGMGLNSVNSRIEKLSGTVLIDSARDRGTVVNIDIPLEPSET